MSLEIVLQPQLLSYDPAALERWRLGDRDDCSDPYCRRGAGTTGFGEFIVGQHFERQGWRWIHHDFDVFGTNVEGKYPLSESVLKEFFGPTRLAAARSLCKTLRLFGRSVETPDILAYKADGSVLRFAESKRTDTGDKIRPAQALGLAFIAAAFGCPVDLFVVAPAGTSPSLAPIRMTFPQI